MKDIQLPFEWHDSFTLWRMTWDNDADSYTVSFQRQHEPRKGKMDHDHYLTDYEAVAVASHADLLAACKYVIQWHREHDSGEGELFGLDFVTTCIGAVRRAEGK